MTQIIDMFAHIRGPKYTKALEERTGQVNLMPDPIRDTMEGRIASIEEQCFGYKYTSVLSTMQENIERLEDEIYLCKICNDEYVELIETYPYFNGAAALLPTSDMRKAVKEAERAISQLHMSGLLVGSHIQGDLLGHEKMWELYDLAAEYDVPIWIHPYNRYHGVDFSPLDYSCETTKTMMDLTTCGVFEKHPDIKFITHHGGGVTALMYPRIKAMYYDAGSKLDSMPPMAASKLPGGDSQKRRNWSAEEAELYYGNLRKFYFDTAYDGVASDALTLRCGFFGIDHALFSGDFPGGPTSAHSLRDSCQTIEGFSCSEEEKAKIYNGNAKKLLKL